MKAACKFHALVVLMELKSTPMAFQQNINICGIAEKALQRGLWPPGLKALSSISRAERKS
jgi:hypothetical protein